jgi:hypothetical protein
MRINVYSQELTSEVIAVQKVSNTGIEYKAIQFVLHSSPMLHHPPKDDDRSAVTFWLPQSVRGLQDFHLALSKATAMVSRLVPLPQHEALVAKLQAENAEMRAGVEKWKACRVHDVEEKEWLRDQMIALRAALEELAVLGEEGMKPDYREWLTFHDKVAQIARNALARNALARNALARNALAEKP